MLGNDVAEIIDNLIVQLLAARAPLFGAGEFLDRFAQTLHAEELGFAVEVGVDLVTQCAEENHLQSFAGLMGEVVQISFGGVIIAIVLIVGGHHLETKTAQDAFECESKFTDGNGVAVEVYFEMIQHRLGGFGDEHRFQLVRGIAE